MALGKEDCPKLFGTVDSTPVIVGEGAEGVIGCTSGIGPEPDKLVW